MFAGPAGAANAVDIVGVGGGFVEIDNVSNTVDVQAAGGNVGGHQHLQLIVLEQGESPQALTLGFVAMNGSGGKAAVLQSGGQSFHTPFGAAKNEDFFKFSLAQEGMELGDFFIFAADADDILVNALGGIGRFNRDGGRRAEKGVDNAGNVGGNGSREKQRLADWRQERKKEADVFDEANVDHAVDFVENNGLEVG